MECIPSLAMNGITLALFNKYIIESALWILSNTEKNMSELIKTSKQESDAVE